jgi:sulfite reductase (NADPH) flavoprotein alpha-component
MTISIWRYSHVILAISSFIFILIAAITGIILAFEPISNQLKPYAVSNGANTTLSKTIQALQEEYQDVVSIEIDNNDFVSASVITKSGDNKTFYINPFTGKAIGKTIEKAPVFKFATNLHRSLFLKSTGRFIVGFASFLLFLMAVTGVLLIVKRQGGFKRFFSNVVKENFEQYYHVLLGRYLLLPIVIITLTGVYLSLEKFSLLPEHKISHSINEAQTPETPTQTIANFPLFKTLKLEEVKRVEFPFSDDVADYFFVELANKELLINQYTGHIVSEEKKPLVALASYWSLVLHTGQGSIIWSIVLLLASCAILLFVYSGFVMTLKRKKQHYIPKNKFSKDEADYIILVGSETGSTYGFATSLFESLIAIGKSVFISELNHYTNYKRAKHLLVFTSTYGLGDPPANAKNFEALIQKTTLVNTLNYAVVGFGSLAYQEFCKYAVKVDAALQIHPKYTPILPIYKINNQSVDAFKDWVKQWCKSTGLKIDIKLPVLKNNLKKTQSFTVVDKSILNIDNSFTLRLRPNKKVKFNSGDLLSVIPKNDQLERLYSIGKIDNDIVLSIKKHALGVCSNYLNNLKKNDMIEAKIKPNPEFNFPVNAKQVLMVANGTGIAPFLGMINANKNSVKTYLFWGGRTHQSFKIYSEFIDRAFYDKKIAGLYLSFSKEESQKKYVQNSIKEREDLICRVLKNKGNIMICGSLAMQKQVMETLDSITKNNIDASIKKFENNNQIQSDCY